MKVIILLISMTMVMLLIGGCSVEQTENGVRVHEVYSIGERAEYGNLAITVRGIRIEYSQNNETLLVIDSLIENAGNSDLAVSVPTMFALFDKYHYSMDQALMVELRGDLNAIISPGRKVAGEIAYVIDEKASDWNFVFAPRSFGLNEVVFQITKENLASVK